MLRAPAPRRGGEKGIGTRQSHFLTRPDILIFHIFIYLKEENEITSPEKKGTFSRGRKRTGVQSPFYVYVCTCLLFNVTMVPRVWKETLRPLGVTMGNAVSVTRVLLAGDSLLRHYWRDHSIKGRWENTCFLYNFFRVELTFFILFLLFFYC